MQKQKEQRDICKKVFEEYRRGIEFKNSIGTRGLYQQAKINERFYVGDQWHGAQCGNDRPLVRHNIIKRIGDYKIAVVASAPVSVNYTAEGVPNTVDLQKKTQKAMEYFATANGQIDGFGTTVAGTEEINLVMSAMTDYYKVTAERLKFDTLKEQVLRNAYISSTGVLYSYWDETLKTGLYADEGRTKAIKGDIACEVIDIENVYFGDPAQMDIQKQPYIILAQRQSVAELKREAKRYGARDVDLEQIKPDEDYNYMAGDYGQDEADGAKKATVLIKLWKTWNDTGTEYTIKAVKVCQNTVIRPEWDIQLRLYPVSTFTWERRRNNAYGESEITYLVPNQIAINRMLTASVWAVMMLGMPIMVVNGDVVDGPVTNEPGQVLRVYGSEAEIRNAVQYAVPPNFAPNFDNNIVSLINQTLTQAGANEAALGDMRPDNTSAIIAVREAATLPLQTVQNRYYQFCEDTARIWAEFWIMMYGKRSLKMEDDNGTWYMPFDGARFKDLLVSVRVDVGSATLYGEAQTIQTLDNLFSKQVIDTLQYLERLPKGLVPDVTGLIKELKAANEAAQQMAMQQASAQAGGVMPSYEELAAALTPEELATLENLPPEQQQAILQNAMGGAPNDGAGIV